MLQTYEDTLLNHLTHLYSSERIAAVLPRERKSIHHQDRLESISEAQILLDQMNKINSDRDQLLCRYVHWQKNK